jgi:biotin operon repressor
MTMTQKLATAFKTGQTIDADTITRKFGLKNPREAVRQLRAQGYCIYTNSNGYRLGTPTKRMVALVNRVTGSALFSGV